MDVLTTQVPAAFDAPLDAGATPYEGYDEATVDDFLRAVAEEQARLSAQLDDAERREQRARSLIGMHEVMVATMRDAYADVTATRRAAEATAAATVRDAERLAAGDPRRERHAMNGPLTRPEPRRIVPRAVVDALIADADREISSLELQVERAVAAADVAEARLTELGIDERASAWATVQLERFVTELRADADAESLAVVAEAEVRARLLVEEAESEARHLGLFAAVAPEPGREPEPELAGAVDEPVPTPEPTPAVDLALVEPLPTAPASTPLLAPDAESDRDPVFHEITPEALAADVGASLDVDPSGNGFWPAEPERKRRRFSRCARSRRPRSPVSSWWRRSCCASPDDRSADQASASPSASAIASAAPCARVRARCSSTA